MICYSLHYHFQVSTLHSQASRFCDIEVTVYHFFLLEKTVKRQNYLFKITETNVKCRTLDKNDTEMQWSFPWNLEVWFITSTLEFRWPFWSQTLVPLVLWFDILSHPCIWAHWHFSKIHVLTILMVIFIV